LSLFGISKMFFPKDDANVEQSKSFNRCGTETSQSWRWRSLTAKRVAVLVPASF
jgi:hypothetical protein